MQPEDSPRRGPIRNLVLACGNTLRGDDGVGWRVGSLLLEDPRCDGIEVMLTQQLLPEHAEAVSRADTVLFLDCSAVSPPGVVATEQILPAEALPRVFTHYLDPSAVLALAGEIYGRVPSKALFVTIGGHAFDLSEELSEAVAAAVPPALEAIYQFLDWANLQDPVI